MKQRLFNPTVITDLGTLQQYMKTDFENKPTDHGLNQNEKDFNQE